MSEPYRLVNNRQLTNSIRVCSRCGGSDCRRICCVTTSPQSHPGSPIQFEHRSIFLVFGLVMSLRYTGRACCQPSLDSWIRHSEVCFTCNNRSLGHVDVPQCVVFAIMCDLRTCSHLRSPIVTRIVCMKLHPILLR